MLLKVGKEGEILQRMGWAGEGKCFSCGNVKSLRLDVGAMSPDFKACEGCVNRYGAEQLAKEADRLLEVLTSPEWKKKYAAAVDPKCFHCGSPTFQNPDGTIPLMCQSCWKEYQCLFAHLPSE